MDNFSAEILQVLKLSVGEVTSCDLNVNYILAVGSSDRLVRVMEWKTGLGFVDKNYSPMNYHKYGVTSVKFSPKGTMLGSSSLDGTAIVLDVLKEISEKQEYQHNKRDDLVQVEECNGELLDYNRQKKVQRCLFPKTGAKIYTMVQYNTVSIKYCDFTPDSTKFITIGDDTTCCFWNLLQHSQIRYFQLYESEFNIEGFSISPDSEYLISVCSEGQFNLWFVDDILTNQPRSLLVKRNIHDVISSCDFSPVRQVAGDRQLLKFTYRIATCGTEGLVKLWELIIKRSQEADNFECDLLLFHILKGHDNDVYSLRFNSSGHYLASAGLDNYVNVWQVTHGDHKAKFKGHSKFVTCSCFSKDSVILVTGSSDKTLIVWDLTRGLTLDSDFSKSCNVSSHFTNVDLIYYHSENKTTNHTEKHDEFDVLQILTLSSIVNTVHFYGNDLLAIAGGEKTITIWKKRMNTFVEEVKLKEHKYCITYLDISPCGNKVISCSVSGETIFWDLGMNLSFKMKNPGSVGGLRTCKFSPDSKVIAAAGDSQEVYLWNASNLEFLMTLERGDNAITSVAFTPDSKYLVSACSGGNITLYDVERGVIKALRSNAHDLGILCCDFSPVTPNDETVPTKGLSCREGYVLATCGNDSYVKLWKTKSSGIKISAILTGHRGAVIHVKFSSGNSNFLASCATDATIRIWETRIKQCLHILNRHKSTVTSCSFSQDSSLLVSGSLDKTALIWRLKEGYRLLIQESTPSFNKPLENWSATDFVNWFTSISCPELANKIKTKPFDGKKFLCSMDDSIATFIGLGCENDIEELKEKFQWLRKGEIYFACDRQILKNVPHKYLCPITHQIMKNPVICSDGFTYDQEAITEWFIGGNFTSPVTSEILTSTKLLPNATLKINIYKFLFANARE